MQIINQNEMTVCYNFADEGWKKRSQSVQQFGADEPRTRDAFLADQISGKLAELILKKELE